MDARDYNLCLSADRKDAVIARNHGYGFFDNRIVTDEFLWVCEQLGYVKERTCTIKDGSGYDPILDDEFWHLSCGHLTIGYKPRFCHECGAKVME